MKALIDKYLKYLIVEKNSSQHTVIAYKNDLYSFHKFISDNEGIDEDKIELNSITRLSIRLWLGELSDSGIAKSSIARKVAALRSFFKYCFKRGHIEKNPAHLLIVPKKDKNLPKTVSNEDITRLFETFDESTPLGIQDRTIFEVLYGTGIRLSELIGLNMTDVNLREGQIIVTGKGNKQRIVPLGKNAKLAIKEHLSNKTLLYGSETDSDARKALFIAPSGQRIYPMYIQRLVDKYLNLTSEVTQKSPHVLRHSFATHMLNNGADIRIIKEFLGHASLAATQVYTHTSVERLKNVFDLAHPRAKS